MKTVYAYACCACLAAGALSAQSTPGYLLSVFQPQVKLDKRLEFEAAAGRIAEVHRKPNGNRWVAYMTTHGSDEGTYYFTSRHDTWAAMDASDNKFLAMLTEAMGSGLPKFFTGIDMTLVRSRSEIRRRLPELSVGAGGASTSMKRLAGYRMMRTVRVELKPGRSPEFIEAWKPWQAELERAEPKPMALVSVTATGRSAIVIAMYHKDMAEIDAGEAALRKSLGGEVYREFQRKVADVATSVTWEIHRFMPNLSSVDEELIAADGFWKPRPNPAAAVKKTSAPVKKQ